MTFFISSWAIAATVYAVLLVLRDVTREDLFNDLSSYSSMLETELNRYAPPIAGEKKENRKALHEAS